MTTHRTFFIITAVFLAAIFRATASDQSPAATNSEAQVTQVVRSMFAALAAEDIPKLHALIAPHFYAFEAGGRITGDALIELIKRAHAAGRVYVWTVNEPEVHIDGSMAWITYTTEAPLRMHPRQRM